MYLILYGMIIASFFTVVCRAEDSKILYRRSQCDSCNRTLDIRDLIPIVSFIFLRGKCRYCNNKINTSYFFGELLLGGLFVLPLLIDFQFNHLQLYYLLVVLIVPLALLDIEKLIIPNHMLVLLLFTGLFITQFQFIDNIWDSIIIAALNIFYLLLNDQIGYGDIKLFSVLTLLLPINVFINIILFTFIIGGLFVIYYILVRNSQHNKLPLVPFILNSIIITFILNEELSLLYLGGNSWL